MPEPIDPIVEPVIVSNTTTFTQEQLNVVVADRAKRAKESAETALLKSLGITDVEEGKRFFAEAKTASDAKKTAEDLAKENENKAITAGAEATRKAAEKEFAADTKVALIEAGVAKDRIDRLRGLLTVGVGATEAEIVEDVEKIKKEFPELFAPAKSGMPHGDTGRGGAGTGKGNGASDPFKDGNDLAASETISGPKTPKLFAGINL